MQRALQGHKESVKSILSVNDLMATARLFALLATSVLLLQITSAQTPPPVAGSFGDPLKWCPPIQKSLSDPTNVNTLRPTDFHVVAALGDSITAGFGVGGFWGGFTEERGKSWAMGGDTNVASLANFLGRYSPNLQGASVGSHFVEVCADYFCPSAHVPAIDHLNAAQSGAWGQNLPDQAVWLTQQMKANTKIDFEKDWKLVTILIGANNLCASCIPLINPIDTAAEFGASMDKTLDLLAAIPRTLVNVVQIFNLSSVYEVSKGSPYCKNVHGDFPLECECDFSTAAHRALADDMASKFRTQIGISVNKAKTKSRQDWTVVLQPILSQGKIPDITYLSDLDCFHPSAYGQRALAIAVWNCMLLPTAQKPTSWTDAMLFPLCPDNSTTIRTD